jgi:gas vesicle protein
MRVKKRVKRGFKEGIKSVKSAPPEAYTAGAGVLVGGAAVLLLTATKSGRELLTRTAQLALRSEADERESQESDVQEEVLCESAEDADVEKKQEADARGEESAVTELEPRIQRPRRPRKAAAPRKSLQHLARPSATSRKDVHSNDYGSLQLR